MYRRLIDTLATLSDHLREAHKHEVADGPFGGPKPCTYCQALDEAAKLLHQAGPWALTVVDLRRASGNMIDILSRNRLDWEQSGPIESALSLLIFARHAETLAQCEACGGIGVLYPTDPDCCRETAVPEGCVIVHRCDACQRFATDEAAAVAGFDQVRFLDAPCGGHTLGVLSSVRAGFRNSFTPAVDPP